MTNEQDRDPMTMSPEEQQVVINRLGALIDQLSTLRLEDLVSDMSYVSAIAPFVDPTAFWVKGQTYSATLRIAQAAAGWQRELFRALPHLANRPGMDRTIEGLDDDPGANSSLVGLQGDRIVILRPKSSLTRQEARNLAGWLMKMAGDA